MNTTDLAIIGGGPAGLFTASCCGRAGVRNILLEGGPRAGRKLLVTGQGQCNITNAEPLPDFISRYGERKNFVRKCLYGFKNCDLIDFFEAEGLSLTDRGDGKIFPESLDSRDVLKLLLKLCDNSYTKLSYNSKIAEASRDGELFTLRTEGGVAFSSRRLLIAAGGFTYPSTGSDGSGYRIAEDLGHSIVPPRPALAAVTTTENDFSTCSGIGLRAETGLHRNGSLVSRHSGDLLFTHKGLSGPLIIDNSREIRPGDLIRLSLLPGVSAETLASDIKAFCAGGGSGRIKKFFTGQGIPDRVCDTVFTRAGVDPGRRAAELTRTERADLVRNFTGLGFRVASLDGRNRAMCTAGGVDTSEINPATMESRIVPGLYFAGEVIDVDGDSGGFNLQFAFSSAHAAAAAVVKSVLNEKS